MDADDPGAVSVLSFAHLGYQKDLKSTETYHAALGLQRDCLLHRLHVLDVADSGELNPARVTVPVPGGKTIPRIYYLADRVYPVDARTRIMTLLDRFASRTIGDASVLYTFPQFERSLRAQKAAGGTTTAYAATVHPATNERLLREELVRGPYDEEPNAPIPENHAFHLADYVLNLSEFSTASYREAGFDDDQILEIGPIGVDASAYEPTGPSGDEFVVLFVANATVLKGLGYLLDAWEQLSLDDARLVLCGLLSEAVRDAHGDQIASMDSVNHVGYVNDPRKYYEQASVLVHPSLSESFGKVVLEAMASALPVVITEHGPTEYVDDAGFAVPIRDADALADRIRYLSDNPDEAAAIGRRGREIAEAATWEAFGSRVADAHRTVLDRGGYDV